MKRLPGLKKCLRSGHKSERLRGFYFLCARGIREAAPGGGPLGIGRGDGCLRGVKVLSTWEAERRCTGSTRPFKSRLRWSVRRGRLACLAVLILGLHFPLAGRAHCADQAPTEFQVKAAYLFNFLKFVEWPEGPGSDPHGKWVIGFVGDSPIGNELARLAQGKNVLGRDLQVKKLQAADDPRGCNILFVSESEKKHLPALFMSLRGSSVLTVADMDNFIGAGGMVQFVVEDARVRVAIDVGATERAHLKVSSKLLALARVVAGPERGGAN